MNRDLKRKAVCVITIYETIHETVHKPAYFIREVGK